MGSIKIVVQYGLRTWAEDCMNIVFNALDKKVQRRNKFQKWLGQHEDSISIFTSIGVAIIFMSLIRFIPTSFFLFNIPVVPVVSNPDSIQYSVNSVSIINHILILFALATLIIIIIGTLTTSAIRSYSILKRSFIIMNESNLESMRKHKEKYKRNVVIYTIGALGSIVTGVVSNFLFYFAV
jgi:hypothetical protein